MKSPGVLLAPRRGRVGFLHILPSDAASQGGAQIARTTPIRRHPSKVVFLVVLNAYKTRLALFSYKRQE